MKLAERVKKMEDRAFLEVDLAPPELVKRYMEGNLTESDDVAKAKRFYDEYVSFIMDYAEKAGGSPEALQRIFKALPASFAQGVKQKMAEKLEKKEVVIT